MAKHTAATADKHFLYQNSVQDPPTDVRFIQRVFRAQHGRGARILREDFCGTALLCCEWVRDHPERSAYGLDLHGPTLRWGREHNMRPMGDAAERVQLLRQNVLDAVAFRPDVTVAFNFSYCVFKQRDAFVDYARIVRRNLAAAGAFFLDIHGGIEATSTVVEKRREKGFTYVWEQMPYDAINGYGIRYIHYHFPDGTRLQRAFRYDWRHWTLPELRDILMDAGFARVDVYWEGVDENGDGSGIFRRQQRAIEEQSWIAYVVGWKA